MAHSRALAILALVALPGLALGADGWRELRTDHFVLLTDAPAGEARETLDRLEVVHGAVEGALFSGPRASAPLRVVAFSSRLDFAEHAGDATSASVSVGGEPAILVPTGGDAAGLPALVARQLLREAYPRAPIWLVDGLSAWVNTLNPTAAYPGAGPRASVDPGGRTMAVGGVPAYALDRVRPWFGGLARVLTRQEPFPRTYEERGPDLAWALVHYLQQRHASAFVDYRARLAAGREPEAAWLEAFPAWDPKDRAAMKALDREVGTYVTRGEFAYRKVPLVTPSLEVRERPLSEHEVKALLRGLPLAWKPPRFGTPEPGEGC
ncbi:MAG: hypothetical protein QM704_26265 [Anaeromyxobacteraceae bacterium]